MVKVVLVVVAFVVGFWFGDHINLYEIEANRAVEECERIIPRNQKCEVIISAEPIKVE